MDERWVSAPGYEGSYEVSDHGRVRALARLDTIGRRRNSKVLSQRKAQSGHLSVALRANNERRTWPVHVLVLTAFVGPRPGNLECCHWDDNPANNHLVNLRWGTRSENAKDSVRNGTHNMASKTHCPQGHPYSPSNTYRYPQGNRACNECRRAYREAHQDERRAKGREYMRRRRAQARAEASPIRKVA
jgi:hypothetical protein